MSRSTDRVVMARALALLFGAGATLVALTLVLPHARAEAQPGLLIPVTLAYLVVTLLLLAPRRATPLALNVILATGTVLVGLCVIFGGPAGAAYAFMYVWVALYAGAFFTPRVTAAHLAWVFTSYVAVLAISGDVRPPAGQWLMAAGTSAITAALVLLLVRELRARTADLAAITRLANEIGSASQVSAEAVAQAVCASVMASTGAASAVLFEQTADGGRLALGSIGSPEMTAPLRTPAGIAALDLAFRSAEPAAIMLQKGSGRVTGLAEPVRHGRQVRGLLAVTWARPQRRLGTRTAESMALFAAEAGVALERISHQMHDHERQAIELNDQIVQGLVVAKYALLEGRVDVGELAIDETLGRARALVDSQLDDLLGDTAPAPGTLRAHSRAFR